MDLTRERQIFEWKIYGKGYSWAKWCHMNGIRVHASNRHMPHSDAVDAPGTSLNSKTIARERKR